VASSWLHHPTCGTRYWSRRMMVVRGSSALTVASLHHA
jgi:hypothetical protein